MLFRSERIAPCWSSSRHELPPWNKCMNRHSADRRPVLKPGLGPVIDRRSSIEASMGGAESTWNLDKNCPKGADLRQSQYCSARQLSWQLGGCFGLVDGSLGLARGIVTGLKFVSVLSSRSSRRRPLLSESCSGTFSPTFSWFASHAAFSGERSILLRSPNLGNTGQKGSCTIGFWIWARVQR